MLCERSTTVESFFSCAYPDATLSDGSGLTSVSLRCHDVIGDGSDVRMGHVDPTTSAFTALVVEADFEAAVAAEQFPKCLAVCDNFVIGNKQFKPRNATDVSGSFFSYHVIRIWFLFFCS